MILEHRAVGIWKGDVTPGSTALFWLEASKRGMAARVLSRVVPLLKG